MAKKPLENTYELENGRRYMTDMEIRQSLRSFDYLTSNFQQIVNKDRQMVPFKLNAAQRYIFKTLLPMIDPATRLNRHRQCVIVKGRQIGASVSVMAFVNYICAFAEGIERMTILHSLPVVDTISKLTKRKVEPIITGMHPDIFPVINKDTLGSSIVYTYEDIAGVRRDNRYELISASSKSIRGDTISVWLADEVSFYRHPEDLEDIVGAAMPDHGFSLSVFFSTYGDAYGDFFKRKLLMARDHPEDMDLIFVPWFMSYPETPLNATWEELGELSDYEQNVILPALEAPLYAIPKEDFPDKILWYRRKRLTVSNMKQEFPTTLDEVIAMGENRCVFSDEAIEYQRSLVEDGGEYTLMSDVKTNEVKAVPAEDGGSFKIYRKPALRHKYILMIDPITAENEDTDFFAASVFDMDTLEQMATFRDKNMPVEDYADICVSIAKIYNRALICPEKNMAQALVVCIRALGYYNFWYESPSARAKKDPGIRTSVSTKNNMITGLQMLLEQKRLKLHDKIWVDELGTFEKKITTRRDGSESVKMMARAGHHDDTCATLWCLVGALDQKQLQGVVKPRVAFF